MMHMMWWKMVSITDDLSIGFLSFFQPIDSNISSINNIEQLEAKK